MLTPKQNVLEVLNWGKPEYIPMTFEAFRIVGPLADELLEEPFRESGTDPFGIKWIVTPEGAMVDTSCILLEDIADWKEKVIFPDLNKIDITEAAKIELKDADRENQLISFYYPCGLFERLAAFMGFEEALISLVTDPESCHEFFEAMTEYKIKAIEKIYETYKPDILVYFDDLATARGTFMSPDTYRSVIKPHHRRIAEFVKSKGMIFEQHTCGRCEDLLEDYVEIGAAAWQPAQCMNDLEGIQKKFKGRLVIEGGWDSSGPCSYMNASEEDLCREIRRNIDTYGKNSGFILMPVLLNEKGNPLLTGDDSRMPALFEEWKKYCK